MILALASDANAYTVLGAGEERHETDRYVLWLGPYPGPSAAVAQRLRIPAGEVEEMRAAIRIAAVAFEMPADELPERLGCVEEELAREGRATATYLAFLDGVPVARATAAFTPHGVLLFGGATLPHVRGHGCYRALVRVRWEDAVARGTPALVTHAGAMSRPILRTLGFRELTTIRVLVDASARSGSMAS